MADPIPVLHISAPTHYAAGEQIGAACRAFLHSSLARNRVAAPPGMSWSDLCDAIEPYRAATRQHLPWIADEIEGCAAAAEIEPRELWVLGVEEVWRRPVLGKCSDFAVRAPATADGGVWLAHNNDLGPATEPEVVALRWELPNEPIGFTLGLGPYISIGFNNAGLSLTGNELGPTDDRVGIPRLLLVRDMLVQKTVHAAVRAALHPARASSYNDILAHRDGTIIDVEGSGGDHALLYPNADGWLVHTNHYTAPHMRRYESDVPYAMRSAIRYRRAATLMQTRSGPVTPALLKTFLADHENAPFSVCRHNDAACTVFWAVIDLNHLAVEFGRGWACLDAAQHFAF